MTNEEICKAVYELLSDIYEMEGVNSVDHTLGQIMGIMDLALKLESIATSEETPDHDGCTNCKWVMKTQEEQPCSGCKQNYFDKWEKRDE